ncbi:MAG: TIGR02147 family protein [Fibrobacteraceae bacterium]
MLLSETPPSVFGFFDFREFLKARQKWLKARKPFFTLEYIAQKLDLKSKGHVSLILSGAKTVPEAKIERLAECFFLEEREREFFVNLVHYNQEPTYRQKKAYLDRMVALMRISNKKLVPAQYRICEKWFYPIVLEILRLHDFKEDWSALGKLVRPAITAVEAKEAVQVLQGIDLIQKNPQGFWEPTDTLLTFGEGWKSVAARNFQSQTIEMAQQALVEIAVEERDISTLTLSMGSDTFHKIQQSIQLLRKEILAMVQADGKADCVYQMNISLFPVSNPVDAP